MLQQTTVKAVEPYFRRFIERFPSLASLAAATEAEVLKYWEGLGYYSRGRNLLRGAQYLLEYHAGQLPGDVAALQQVPGIGRYTAGAIASFGFGLPAPILEANTLRLYSRLLAYPGDPRSAAGQRTLWALAAQLPDEQSAGRINQALMELGSLICRPQQPRCEECPVQQYCAARAQGLQEQIPPASPRPESTPLVEGCLVIRQGPRLLVRQRQAGEWWAGMWDFPRYSLTGIPHQSPLSHADWQQASQQLQERLLQEFGLTVEPSERQWHMRHAVTRYRIRLLVLTAECDSSGPEVPQESDQPRWVSSPDLQNLPLTTTARRILNWCASKSKSDG
jgi:A/G-specific adenine glycosylase